MSAFIAQAFVRTTTADVARHARVSKRDLFRLFPDKTDLFLQAVLSHRHLIVDLPRPDGERLPLLATLRLIFRLDLTGRAADERDALLNLIARESMLMPELNARLYDGSVIRTRELLMDWLAGRVAAGDLPACDTANVAGLLMDVTFGALLPRRQRTRPVDRSRQSKDIMARLDIVLRGLLRPDGPT